LTEVCSIPCRLGDRYLSDVLDIDRRHVDRRHRADAARHLLARFLVLHLPLERIVRSGHRCSGLHSSPLGRRRCRRRVAAVHTDQTVVGDHRISASEVFARGIGHNPASRPEFIKTDFINSVETQKLRKQKALPKIPRNRPGISTTVRLCAELSVTHTEHTYNSQILPRPLIRKFYISMSFIFTFKKI